MNLRKGIYLTIALLLFILLSKQITIDTSVFNISPKSKEEFSWDAYVKDREKRNAIKMQKSYEELMLLGHIHSESSEWDKATENFFYAKSLFPDRIEPRKQLCYAFLMNCQADIRYCTQAKRELYFAMKYVDPADRRNMTYLSDLVALVQMEEIVDLSEEKAMAQIY